jgi:hypothetical protein
VEFTIDGVPDSTFYEIKIGTHEGRRFRRMSSRRLPERSTALSPEVVADHAISPEAFRSSNERGRL